MKVLIAAGGTGGHLFPAQQLAKTLGPDAEVLFAGHDLSKNPFFNKAAFTDIAAHPFGLGFFKASWKGFWQSVRMIRSFSPDVVVGFGSFHTFPVLLAAAVLRKKMILFEANCVLGKVNRLFAPIAKRIAVQFPIPLKKAVAVPLLPWTDSLCEALATSEARKGYGLNPDLPTVLVFGGSQGAAFLNATAPAALGRLPFPVQAIHLTGSGKELEVQDAYRRLAIACCVKDFEPQMHRAYAAATLAFCRSGAGTLAELIRFAVPSLLIPYPYATEDHQRKNGEYLAQLGGARVLLQAGATPELVASELQALLQQEQEKREALASISQASRNAVHLATIIEELA